MVIFSAFGRNWTAYAEVSELAGLIGGNRKALLVQTTALGVALAGTAGALIVLLYGGPDSPAGTLPAIKAIMAGLIGRTRSVNAAVTAGFAIGILEAGLSNVLSSKTLEPTIYAVLAAALILRAWDDQCIPSKSHSSRGKE